MLRWKTVRVAATGLLFLPPGGCSEQPNPPIQTPSVTEQALPVSVHAYLAVGATNGVTRSTVISIRMGRYPTLIVKPNPDVYYPILRVKPVKNPK